jgi:hypothetical protein
MDIHVHFVYENKEQERTNNPIDCKHYCSDSCNQLANGENYQGWNGRHEIDESTFCDNCNKKILGIEDYDNSYWCAKNFLNELGSDYDYIPHLNKGE